MCDPWARLVAAPVDAETIYDLKGVDGRAKLRVVPDAWAGPLARAMVGSDTRSPGPRKGGGVTEIDVHAVRDATEMFGNDDYRYGGGRPKLWVAKYLESDVLPQVQYMEPTKPLG
ncbi:MAG: hypothetical protein ACRDRN_22775, partial [Sciscionella sp.]